MNRRKFLKMGAGLGGLTLAGGALAACGTPAATPAAAPAAPAASTGGVDKSKLSTELSWYTWGGYESQAVFDKFEKEFGVKVRVDTYSSNEEMEAKFKAGGNPGYDLITPSDYMVAKMAAAGLLEKVDWANIPNFKNVAPGHKGLYYDPKDEWSVAYNFGSTGLAYDKSKVSAPITTWKQVFEWPDALKGKLGLLDDMRELLAVGLRFKGFSGNASSGEEINSARDALIDLKKRINYTLTDSPTGRTNIVAGDSVAAMIYTNDAVMARGENPNIVYVIPGDVSTIWQDNNCIPVGAKNKYTAEVFVDFMLRPDISAELANELGLGTPNLETLKQGLIDKALTDDKAVYPDIVGMGKGLEYLRKGDPAVDELFQRAFDELKNA
jgi:spermidine/putrescine transport system substrate-binding protein